MHCAWTVTAKFDFSYFFQPISAHRALFMDPQISLFNNFFIKNWSHGTIHTFKNYFTTVFFSFSFQFSAVSKWTRNKSDKPTEKLKKKTLRTSLKEKLLRAKWHIPNKAINIYIRRNFQSRTKSLLPNPNRWIQFNERVLDCVWLNVVEAVEMLQH